VGSVASNEDGRPDWGSAPEFSEVAPRAFTYGRHKARAGLLSDIRTRYGTSGLEEFLITTADVGARGNNHVRRALDGAWGQALSELPRPSRDRVLQRLRHRFINGELGSNSTLRSLRYVELSDRNVLDRIERTLRRSDKFGRWRIAEAIMLRALARHRPHKAGRIACQRLQNESAAELIDGGNTPSDFLREAYLLAVVASGTRCDAVEQLAAEAGIDADVSTMSTIRDRMERIRPRRDFFSARRKAVSEKRMQRLLSAAAAAQETGPRRPHRRRHGCHRRRYHD
jgi:hypothetical protein